MDVLGDDDQRPTCLLHLLQQRQQVRDGGDLAVHQQDERLFQDGLHHLGVGDEVGRDVALVQPHSFGQLQLKPEGVALLDGDRAFLADLVHRLGDQVADLLVGGGDRGGRRDLLARLDLLGQAEQLAADRLDGLLDAAL